MFNWKKTLCAMLSLMIPLFGVGALAEQAAPQNTIGYAVEPILPANQMPGYVSTFNIRVAPGGRQTIQVSILNWADEDIEVAVETGTAFTNVNGVIEYGQNLDESLAVNFADIVVPVKSVVTVPANGQAIAEFYLTIPEEPFRGSLFGGLSFTKLYQDGSGAESGGAMRINNVFRYVINMRLHESDEEVMPAFELLYAVADLTGRSPALVLGIRNPEPCLVRQASLRVSVYGQDGDVTVFTAEKDFDMAPNSSMSYSANLNDANALTVGAYRVSVEIEYKNRIWQLDAPLTGE